MRCTRRAWSRYRRRRYCGCSRFAARESRIRVMGLIVEDMAVVMVGAVSARHGTPGRYVQSLISVLALSVTMEPAQGECALVATGTRAMPANRHLAIQLVIVL
jgi:hypothetical protein